MVWYEHMDCQHVYYEQIDSELVDCQHVDCQHVCCQHVDFEHVCCQHMDCEHACIVQNFIKRIFHSILFPIAQLLGPPTTLYFPSFFLMHVYLAPYHY